MNFPLREQFSPLTSTRRLGRASRATSPWRSARSSASRTGFFRVALGGTKILEAYDKHRAGIALGEFLCTLNEDEPNAASYRFAVVDGGTTSTGSKCRASRSPLFSYLEKLF
jgi:hypothetical protein